MISLVAGEVVEKRSMVLQEKRVVAGKRMVLSGFQLILFLV